MFDFIANGKTLVPQKSLYCVWIRAQQGDDVPLLRVWIDASMTMSKSQAKVHEPDVETARALIQEAFLKGSTS